MGVEKGEGVEEEMDESQGGHRGEGTTVELVRNALVKLFEGCAAGSNAELSKIYD